MKRRTVLITGTAGFIGRYVAKVFSEQGYEVTGIGWGKFPDYQSWGVSCWNECDVNLESLFTFANRPDVIVHCAGGASVGYSVDNPRQDFCMTVDGTSYVLEYVRLYSPSTCIVYPSSAAVYGQVDLVPIPENSSLCPISAYGVHKMMAEQLCQMYAGNYGLSIAIVRLFSVYGEGLRKQLLWDACKKMEQGDATFFGTGEEVRDWLHVQDVSKLLMLAEGHASAACPIVNAGWGEGVKIKDILHQVSQSLGVDFAPEFSLRSKAGDPSVYIADMTKVNAWSWKPVIDWRVGVDGYVRWFKQCQ